MTNILPNVWGPSGWKFIHFVALGYPDNPTNEHINSYQQFYESLQDILPCPKCSDHYQQMIQQYPVSDHLTNRDALFRWSVDIHNQVNKRLGKSTTSYDQALAMYTHPPLSIPSILCRILILILLLFAIYYIIIHK